MSVTWAMFMWEEDHWKLASMTPHDEIVTEFEEVAEETNIPIQVVCLEDPIPLPKRVPGATIEPEYAAMLNALRG